LRFIFASYADQHKTTAHSPSTELLPHPNSKTENTTTDHRSFVSR